MERAKLKNDHVACAAIRLNDSGLILSLPQPARHHTIMHAYFEMAGKPLHSGNHQQGFLARNGDYLSRQDAAALVGKKGALYSEDLW